MQHPFKVLAALGVCWLATSAACVGTPEPTGSSNGAQVDPPSTKQNPPGQNGNTSTPNSNGATPLTLAAYNDTPFVPAATQVAVAVDPAAALPVGGALAVSAWSASGAACHTSGSTLVCTGAAGSPSVSASVPSFDLDLAFYDQIDLPLQVPVDYTGTVDVRFTCDTATAFDDTHMFSVPAGTLARDGAMHTYRVDVGLLPPWRGTLTGLKITLPGTSAAHPTGVPFTLGTVTVGDDEGDIYGVDLTNSPNPGGSQALSKHFRVYWNAASQNAGFGATQAHATLRNLEEAWQHHKKVLAMPDPTLRNNNHLKVNLGTLNSGYYTSGAGEINIDPSGLRTDPPSWVIPHELMHTFQFANGITNNNFIGNFWESHANYGAARYLQWYAAFFQANQNSQLDSYYGWHSYWPFAAGRDYYLCWPVWQYLDENNDQVAGLGSNFVSHLWRAANASESVFNEITRLAPQADIKAILGYIARRNATWKYSNQASLQWSFANGDADMHARYDYAPLRARGDSSTWYQSLPELSPVQGAYAVHAFHPTTGGGSTVVLTLRGVRQTPRGADFRASLVALDANGHERVTDLFVPNVPVSVTLHADENTLLLAVAATPNTYFFNTQDDMAFPEQSDASKVRFPYEVAVTGLAPHEFVPATPTQAGSAHANGGGFVARSATVADTVYIGPHAQVLGSAQVSGNARIEDAAVVTDSSHVTQNARVGGHAMVRGASTISGNARVSGYAVITDSVVTGNARAIEHTTMEAQGLLQGSATSKGTADVYGATGQSYSVGGDAVVDGDFGDGASVTNGFQFGFTPYVGTPVAWISARQAPAYLFASYDFATPQDGLAFDAVGVTHAYMVGAPKCMQGDGMRAGFLHFDSNQYLLLDRATSDFAASTVATWLYLDGTTADAPVFTFGYDNQHVIRLGVQAASVVLTGVSPGTAVQGTWATRIALKSWVHVAVTLNGTQAELFVGGVSQGTQTFAIAPQNVTAPDTVAGRQQNYVARDQAGATLAGAIDHFQVYSGVIGASALQAAMQTDTRVPNPIPQSACTLQGTAAMSAP